MFYIGSPNHGGLYQYEENLLKIADGNVRGMTTCQDQLYYVKDDTVFTLNGKVFNLPAKLGHDIKYDKNKNCFYLMSTEMKKLHQLSRDGNIQREMEFDESYWPNCCWPLTSGELIVFLSAKRPYSKSKIIALDENWNVKWEYYCFENDEIHSPFVFEDDLYWCRSNRNVVVRASLKSKLRDAKRILTNNDGYTRGLFITNNLMVLGTSENRHAETSLCKSNQTHGCVHFYSFSQENYSLQKTVHLDCQEVYDIIIC